MTSGEIIDVFDEVNTDRTEIDGKQVIDEKEFLDFYNSLMEREVVRFIFNQVRAMLNFECAGNKYFSRSCNWLLLFKSQQSWHNFR